MLKWTNPKVEALQERIAVLEKALEEAISRESFYCAQLEKITNERNDLLNKIFSMAGINKSEAPALMVQQPQTPIGGGTRSWAQQKHQLEVAAQKKYWEDKKRQAEIETLEKEVLDDASKIS